MSTDAIFATAMALQRRIKAALNQGSPPQPRTVLIGPPTRDVTSGFSASLFLFQVEPNRDLRNTEVFPVGAPGPFEGPAAAVKAVPLDLRFLVSVFRTGGTGGQAEPDELSRLGEIIAALEAEPYLTDEAVPGQTVRVTLEPASIDEMNRIWDIFPEDSYHTSIIYLATPVFIEIGGKRVGPPVLTREDRTGLSTEAPRFPAEFPA